MKCMFKATCFNTTTVFFSITSFIKKAIINPRLLLKIRLRNPHKSCNFKKKIMLNHNIGYCGEYRFLGVFAYFLWQV